MSALIIVLKIIVTIFLIGRLLGALTKFLPAHRNPDMSPAIEFVVGLLMLALVLYGFYYTWF